MSPYYRLLTILLTSLGPTGFAHNRFNKYSQICARALRQSLKETERVNAEKRGSTILRYQEWKDGQGGQQVCCFLCFRLFLATMMVLFAFLNHAYWLCTRLSPFFHSASRYWWCYVVDK